MFALRRKEFLPILLCKIENLFYNEGEILRRRCFRAGETCQLLFFRSSAGQAALGR